MKLYGEFLKVEKQDDGTLIVSGVASSESVDSDGEVIEAQAIKAAIPDYMKFGAVREMHQPSAAGTALSIDTDDQGVTHFEAHVVDPLAVKKVEAGVYKGFSIGGKALARAKDDKKRITKLKLIEVSLVDRPANPDAVIQLVKFDGGDMKCKCGKPEVTGVEHTESECVQHEPGTGPVAKAATPAAEAAPAPATTEAAPAAVPPEGEPVTKALSDVGFGASILRDLQSLSRWTQADADSGQANGAVPEKIRGACKAFIDAFKTLVEHEVGAVDASLTPAATTAPAADGMPVACAASAAPPTSQVEGATTEPAKAEGTGAAPAGDVVRKGGKRFSAKTKEALAAIHGKIDECSKAMGALGYKDKDKDGDEDEDKDDDVESAAQPGDLTKALTTERDELRKRAETAEAELSKVQKAFDALRLEKGYTKAVPIAKGDDTGTVTKDAPPPAEGTKERADYELRKSWTQPKRIM